MKNSNFPNRSNGILEVTDSPSSSGAVGGVAGAAEGGGEQGGDPESSGSTTGEAEPLEEAEDPGHKSLVCVASNCLETN
jgi:hypothetical protein